MYYLATDYRHWCHHKIIERILCNTLAARDGYGNDDICLKAVRRPAYQDKLQCG